MITILLAILILPILFIFWCVLKIASIADKEDEMIINYLNKSKQ